MMAIPTAAGTLAPNLASSGVMAKALYNTYNLPQQFDFSTMADGALPTLFEGSTWAISGGKVVNTPTVGSNLLLNPGMETWTSATDLASWTDTASNRETTNPHSGTYCNRLDISAGNGGASFSQNPGTQSLGTWMYAYGWVRASATSKTGRLGYLDTVISNATSTDWEKLVVTQRHPGTSQAMSFDRQSAASSSLYFDDAFVGILSLPSLYTVIKTTSANVRAIAEITYQYGTQAGLITNLNSTTAPTTFLLAYLQWNSSVRTANLVKCVNGTYTSLIAQSISTITTNAPLEVRVNGTTAQLFYDGLQMGTDQTIDAVFANYATHGLFSTHENNSFQAIYLGDPTHVWGTHALAISGDDQAYKQGWAQEPNILYENGLFKMWYSSGSASRNIAYATSPDGITWTDYASNPVIPGVTRCSVFKNGSTYHLFAGGSGIDHYTSTDGISWTNQGHILTAGGVGEWDADGLQNTFAWIEDDVWYIYYESHSAKWWCGLATSPDGITWTKDPDNPILGGGVGSYSAPWLTKVGNYYYLWYHGHPTANLPTDVYLLRSTTPRGPWTRMINGLLRRTIANEGPASASGQVADPTLVEVNGVTYIYFDAIPDQLGSDINMAIYNGPISEIVR